MLDDIDIAPWEKEELERWASAEAQEARIRAAEEVKRQAEIELKNKLDNMIITTTHTLPSTKLDIIGIVSDYYYWLDNDLSEDIHTSAQVIEDNLINSIKLKAANLGGDAIVALVINKEAHPTSYMAAGTDGAVAVHFLHCLNVSVTGTVVKLKRAAPILVSTASVTS